MLKRIVILGASGSIGRQTIDVCLDHPDELQIVGISVGKNIPCLQEILQKVQVKYVVTECPQPSLAALYPQITFSVGDEGLLQLAAYQEYDLLVNALVGVVGLKPTLKAIEEHKDIALANKETLVIAGELVMAAIKQYGVKLYPIDSEHSAIYQCLLGNRRKDLKRLIITASGGAFRDRPLDQFKNIQVEDALKHPSWQMGKKITVDSATLMNKGFEVIEAHYLFAVPYSDIAVLMHRESIVHSLVEFNDGSLLAQLSFPDMRLPIQFALLSPKHTYRSAYQSLDLAKVACLHFAEFRDNRDYLIKLARRVGEKAGNLGAVLNAANDTAVNLFLAEKISFVNIYEAIDRAIKAADYIASPDLETILASYAQTVTFVKQLFKQD